MTINENALIEEYAKLIYNNPEFFSITVTKTVTKTDHRKVTKTVTNVTPVNQREPRRVLKNKNEVM